jgi:hypothetical protein
MREYIHARRHRLIPANQGLLSVAGVVELMCRLGGENPRGDETGVAAEPARKCLATASATRAVLVKKACRRLWMM